MYATNPHGTDFVTPYFSVTSSSVPLIPPSLVDASYTDVIADVYHPIDPFTGGSPSCTISGGYRVYSYYAWYYDKTDVLIGTTGPSTYSGQFVSD